MKYSPDNMAIAMMEAIADFSKQPRNVCLVRVVVFQSTMVPTYLEQMKKANNPGSSILSMITTPFRYIGKAFKSLAG